MKVRIGGRGSPLSRAQLDIVASLLRPAADVEIVAMTTTGDRLSRGEAAMTGKDLFTREIDEALLDGGIDLAVHSLKDLPSRLPDGLAIVAVPLREDPSDVLVSRGGVTLGALSRASRVGSSSPRRRAQLLAARPDLFVTEARGNVDTRLSRLSEGRWDAIVLARAGLARLRRLEEVTQVLPASLMLPAIGQGALAVVAREEVGELRELALSLDHAPSHREAEAERARLEVLEAGCGAPGAGLARHVAGRLRLSAAALGREVARQLLDLGAAALLALGRAP